MSELKATPGPWRLCKTELHDIEDDIYAGDEMIGTAWFIEGCKDNAHLMAAAPEMYEALYTIVQSHENEIGGGFLTCEEYDKASATLARARGEA